MARILTFAQPEERPQRSAGGAKHGRLNAATGGKARPCEIVIFPGVRVEYHDRAADTAGSASLSPAPPDAGEPKRVGGKRGRKTARASLSA